MNLRVKLCLTAALTGFAANSLLTRAAIGGGLLDAPSFALLRIVTGAVALTFLARRPRVGGGANRPSWLAALTLTGYLAAFTMAYTRIGAAAGALLLFGAVQLTMTTVGFVRGERPAAIDWAGAGLALAGLLVLTVPGATAPDVMGAFLMVSAGVCWGGYSLVGRASASPLSDTATNFVRASAVSVIPLAWSAWPPDGTPEGVALAAASGTLASGLGYTLWYAALPALSAWRAAVLQLIVPVLTAAGAWLLLGEALTWRLAGAGTLVALGVWCTSSPRRHPPAERLTPASSCAIVGAGMSDRTAPSLAKLDVLLPRLNALAPGSSRDQILEEAAALRRAVAAFHMEAIRFRFYSVDRLLRSSGDDPAARQAFEELRRELETAGFHTRSHAAP